MRSRAGLSILLVAKILFLIAAALQPALAVPAAMQQSAEAKPAEPPKQKKKILILDFEVSKDIRKAHGPVGEQVSNHIIDKLVDSGDYVVIDKAAADKVLKEFNFTVGSRLDSETAKKIGRLIGADIIVYGMVVDQLYRDRDAGDSKIAAGGINSRWPRNDPAEVTARVDVTALIVDVKTAEVIDAISVRAEMDKDKLKLSPVNHSGTDDIKAAIMRAAVDDAASQLALRIELYSDGRIALGIAESMKERKGSFFGYRVDPFVSSERERERRSWSLVRDSDDPSRIEEYLKKYPSGRYLDLARERLEALYVKAVEQALTKVERYPTIESLDEVRADQEFAVEVSLTVDRVTDKVKPHSGNITPDGKVEVPLTSPDEIKIPIEVILSAPDFTYTKGSNKFTITLPVSGNSTPAAFHLKPKPIESATQSSTLFASFWHRGEFLAKVSREIIVRKVPADAPPDQTGGSTGGSTPITIPNPKGVDSKTSSFRMPESEKKLDRDDPVKAKESVADNKQRGEPLAMSRGTRKPDLTIMVIENLSQRQPGVVSIILSSQVLEPVEDIFTYPPDLAGSLDTQYRKLIQYRPGYNRVVSRPGQQPSMVSESEQAKEWMRGFGLLLYEKFAPPVFKDYFWQLRDRLGDNLRSIQIYSSNPVVPWELMRPVRADGSGERSFLGVEYSIGRWQLSKGKTPSNHPPQSLLLRNLVAIAPKYKGGDYLPRQNDELKALKTIKPFQRLPGQFGPFRELFRDFPEGIIHFAGHGKKKLSPDNIYVYSIQLEDGEVDLTALRGMIKDGNKNRPLFFLNACDVGQAQHVASFISGWAPMIIKAGAGGYIGALWPLNDNGATEFAALFYKKLQKSLETGPAYVADILRDTRKQFLTGGNPSFLAYVYYGDPNLKIERVEKPRPRPR